LLSGASQMSQARRMNRYVSPIAKSDTVE
jgi:hypothetical protein